MEVLLNMPHVSRDIRYYPSSIASHLKQLNLEYIRFEIVAKTGPGCADKWQTQGPELDRKVCRKSAALGVVLWSLAINFGTLVRLKCAALFFLLGPLDS